MFRQRIFIFLFVKKNNDVKKPESIGVEEIIEDTNCEDCEDYDPEYYESYEQGNVDKENVGKGNAEKGDVEKGKEEKGNVENGNVDKGNVEQDNFEHATTRNASCGECQERRSPLPGHWSPLTGGHRPVAQQCQASGACGFWLPHAKYQLSIYIQQDCPTEN